MSHLFYTRFRNWVSQVLMTDCGIECVYRTLSSVLACLFAHHVFFMFDLKDACLCRMRKIIRGCESWWYFVHLICLFVSFFCFQKFKNTSAVLFLNLFFWMKQDGFDNARDCVKSVDPVYPAHQKPSCQLLGCQSSSVTMTMTNLWRDWRKKLPRSATLLWSRLWEAVVER